MINVLYEEIKRNNINRLAGWQILADYLEKLHGGDIC